MNLSWDAQFENLMKVLCHFCRTGAPVQTNKYCWDEKILTTHFFGMVYYASRVWLNKLTTCRQRKILSSMHYKVLRCANGDYRNKAPQINLDNIFKSVAPAQWMTYSNAKLALLSAILATGQTYLQEFVLPLTSMMVQLDTLSSWTSLGWGSKRQTWTGCVL